MPSSILRGLAVGWTDVIPSSFTVWSSFRYIFVVCGEPVAMKYLGLKLRITWSMPP